MMRVIFALGLSAVLALSVSAGNRAFREGRFADAVAEYQRAAERGDDSPLLHYNLGTALLRLGRHDEARTHLQLAVAGEAAAGVRQAAHFNAGNVDLEPAFRAQPSAGVNEALMRAVQEYRRALLLDPSDVDAKWNLELAERLLARQAGGGGGGGADDPQQGGDGGPEDDAPAQQDPTPAPGDGGGEAGMNRTEAERVLRTAAERERELQQQKLRRTERPPPTVRDW